jgi:hypothetical protein
MIRRKGAGIVPAIPPFFFLTDAAVQAVKKRYKNVTVLSWLTALNFVKFKQNTFTSKH